MKLRLRSLQSRETQKLEVPDDCTIRLLKERLSHSLSSTSSLRLSLNRKDELSSPSPDDSLLSIGITSGDLIYYEFSCAEQGNAPYNLQDSNICNQNMDVEPDSVVQCFSSSGKSVYQGSDLNLRESCEISKESDAVSMDCPNQQNELLGSRAKGKEILVDGEKLETGELSGGECMDVDSGFGCKRFSVPYFLKRVLREEMGDDFSDTKHVFLAIHAVFLESGFVGFDSISGLRADLFDILKEQASMTFTTTVSYTLPELLSNDNDTESIVLKFQTLGHYVNVYGSLAKGQVWLHKLNIDKNRFGPAIGSFSVIFDVRDRPNEMDSTITYYEKVIFEFWKFVKDGLAMPLMTDLCEKTGLDLPPCLIRLPADLKFQILELLQGQDIARLACVCKEMRYLSSNNELWKEKFISEFGNRTGAGNTRNWKARFESSWKNRKRERYFRNADLFASYRLGNHHPVPRIGPIPFGIPPMIGDDRDAAAGPYALLARAPRWRLHNPGLFYA